MKMKWDHFKLTACLAVATLCFASGCSKDRLMSPGLSLFKPKDPVTTASYDQMLPSETADRIPTQQDQSRTQYANWNSPPRSTRSSGGCSFG